MGVDVNYEDLFVNYKLLNLMDDNDLRGYGIYCVGIVVVVINNGFGIVFFLFGVFYVQVMSIKVLNVFGMGI